MLIRRRQRIPLHDGRNGVAMQDIAEILTTAHPVDGAELAAAPDLSDRLPPGFLRARGVLPLGLDDQGLTVAMAMPDAEAAAALERALGLPVRVRAAPEGPLREAIERVYGDGRSEMERLVAEADEALPPSAEEVEQLKDLASDAPVVRLVGHIVEEAVRLGASDIHIEPYPDLIGLRYRIDGVLRAMPSPPVHLARAIVSRVKILAGLDIAERRLPQDGRVGQAVGGRRIDLRVSTLPTVHGESLVIRILDGAATVRTLSSLGLVAEDEAALRRLVAAPHGLVLVTGPTGSGKTTTLYAALGLLDASLRKVLTVEDPVEIQLPGVNQVQVRPQIGLTFARVLRSMVRQDPDVILVGEMRDRETAEIAVHAALTGHLVLSTLHTNSAAGAVTRLVDMGVEPFLLASTLRGVIGQRLVRTLCPRCRRPAEPDPALAAALAAAGLPASCHAADGCEACGGTGYAGRLAIVELLLLDEALSRLAGERASAAALEAAARRGGWCSMAEDGLRKVAAGLTSYAEVRRVTDV
jgi:general secretion pathway protein E